MKDLDQIINQALSQFDNIPTNEWELKRAPGKWSKKEILGHLIDSARNNLQRFTEIVHGASPYQVAPYHQDQLVDANHYQQESIEIITDLWVALNRHIWFLMGRQSPKDLTLPLRLPSGNSSDLKWLMEDYIDHLEHHLRQILAPGSEN